MINFEPDDNNPEELVQAPTSQPILQAATAADRSLSDQQYLDKYGHTREYEARIVSLDAKDFQAQRNKLAAKNLQRKRQLLWLQKEPEIAVRKMLLKGLTEAKFNELVEKEAPGWQHNGAFLRAYMRLVPSGETGDNYPPEFHKRAINELEKLRPPDSFVSDESAEEIEAPSTEETDDDTPIKFNKRGTNPRKTLRKRDVGKPAETIDASSAGETDDNAPIIFNKRAVKKGENLQQRKTFIAGETAEESGALRSFDTDDDSDFSSSNESDYDEQSALSTDNFESTDEFITGDSRSSSPEGNSRTVSLYYFTPDPLYENNLQGIWFPLSSLNPDRPHVSPIVSCGEADDYPYPV